MCTEPVLLVRPHGAGDAAEAGRAHHAQGGGAAGSGRGLRGPVEEVK